MTNIHSQWNDCTYRILQCKGNENSIPCMKWKVNWYVIKSSTCHEISSRHRAELLNHRNTEGSFDECLTVHRRWQEESKTNSVLHNGLLDLMNRPTCFGHYYAHRQELATIQMASAYGTSPWLWQVAGLVHGCRFLERPVRGMFHDL